MCIIIYYDPCLIGYITRAITATKCCLPSLINLDQAKKNPHKLGYVTAHMLVCCQTYTTLDPHTDQKRLPSKQFQVLLTPSSGSFSSFPHGTCSLSVSRPYLALDGTYHPLRAAIPNNSTLKYRRRTLCYGRVRGSHSPWRPIPGALAFQIKAAIAYLQTTILFFREILMMSFSLFTRSYWGNPS